MNNSDAGKDKKAVIPDKVEDMIAQEPGKYAGDNYDQKKVEAELDKTIWLSLLVPGTGQLVNGQR